MEDVQECKSFKISWTKIEYMECIFSKIGIGMRKLLRLIAKRTPRVQRERLKRMLLIKLEWDGYCEMLHLECAMHKTNNIKIEGKDV